jgi:glycosyltransferase involved in cell wall biosynthesis
VYSLGKEKGGASALAYALRFIALAWKLRHDYEKVFVHMNQEYILIAGWLWELLNKPVYLWRNHYAGSWLTDLAASTCTKVFCTSKHSYTAKYRKTVLMPVGVDLERFTNTDPDARVPHSILFLARMAPSKRPELLLEALAILQQKGIDYSATFIGSPLPENEAYYASLKEQARAQDPEGRITITRGIPSAEAPAAFRAHEIFVNASRSGMFDKTLFEAAASGCLVLATSEDFRDAAGKDSYFENAEQLAERLAALLAYTADERIRFSERMQALARSENLATLADQLATHLAR